MRSAADRLAIDHVAFADDRKIYAVNPCPQVIIREVARLPDHDGDSVIGDIERGVAVEPVEHAAGIAIGTRDKLVRDDRELSGRIVIEDDGEVVRVDRAALRDNLGALDR